MKRCLLASFILASCGPAVGPETHGAEVMPEPGETLEGVALQHIDLGADGTIAAVGLGDFLGQQGDDVRFGSVWVGTFSPDGSVAWTTSMPLEQGLEPSGVALAADGSMFVSIADYADFPESANRVSKYAADGALEWDTVLDARPLDVASTTDGGAVAVGYTLVDEGNAISAWAVRLSASGEVEQTRSWPNPDGRNSSFASIDETPSGFVLAGTWGLGPLTPDSEAWVVFSDSVLGAVHEVRLPHSGGTDFVLDAVATDEHAVVAVSDSHGHRVSEVSRQGEIESSSLPEGLRFLGFAGSSAYVATEHCEDCDAHLFGAEGSTIIWESALEGCIARAADGVAREQVAAAVGCDPSAPNTQLWR